MLKRTLSLDGPTKRARALSLDGKKEKKKKKSARALFLSMDRQRTHRMWGRGGEEEVIIYFLIR